ncbi:MAG: PAS domain S-box protein, partial [Limnobacter sp.]|nr:PAS domain S-box protein [Limnobacter sp.]
DSGEYCRYNKEGKPVWIQATYNPILDAHGKPTRIVKFCSDITASKTATLEATYRMQAVSDYNMIIEMDPKGKVTSGNALAQSALGMSKVQLIDAKMKDLLGPNSHLKMTWDDILESLHAGHATAGDFELLDDAGKKIWVSGGFSPILNPSQKLEKILLIAREITASKLNNLDAAAKLGAIDRAQAVIEFDLQGNILSANKNFLEFMEYSLDEIKGQHHQIFVDPEFTKSRDYENFWARLGKGQYDAGEFKRLTKSGKEVWIQATYNPVYDPAGKPFKVVKFATDITTAKFQAAEADAKVKAIDMGQAVIEFDLSGNILNANRNFLKAMGYTLREIQGQHHSMFCTLEYSQSPAYRDFWLRLNDKGTISGRFHRIGKFNREVWIQATYNPILDLNGNVIKIIKYAYDITKEVQMEQIIKAESVRMEDLCTKV